MKRTATWGIITGLVASFVAFQVQIVGAEEAKTAPAPVKVEAPAAAPLQAATKAPIVAEAKAKKHEHKAPAAKEAGKEKAKKEEKK